MDKSSKNEQIPEEPVVEEQQAHVDELVIEESGTIAELVTSEEGDDESSFPRESVEENQAKGEETLDEGEEPQQESEETEQITEGEESDTSNFDDESMPDMDALYNDSLKAFAEGEIVEGHVVNVTSDEVMIDIGFKSEGYVSISEF